MPLAFKKIKGSFFIRIDSDLQDDPKDIGQIVNELKKRSMKEATEHKKIYRPWGNYESISSDKSLFS